MDPVAPNDAGIGKLHIYNRRRTAENELISFSRQYR